MAEIVETAHKITDTSCPWTSTQRIHEGGWNRHLVQQVLIVAFSRFYNGMLKEHKQQRGMSHGWK